MNSETIIDLELEPEEFVGATKVGDLIPGWVENFKRKKADPNYGICSKFGIRDLDSMIQLRESELTVIAGRPGMGKSALAGNVALYSASTCGGAVAYFSMEMANSQMIQRFVANIGKIDFRKEVNSEAVVQAIWKLKNMNLHVDDRGGMTPKLILKEVEKLENLKVVICDYLGLIGSDEREDKLYIRIGQNMKALRNIAKKFKCAMVVLCQMNRKATERVDKTPQLGDLRDSGNIEEDADNVIFIDRPAYHSPKEKDTVAFLTIAKQRQGPTGQVEVVWDAATSTFSNVKTF